MNPEYCPLRIFGVFRTLGRVKMTRVEMTRFPLTRPSMYTVQFQGHKGWPAVLGMLGALYGIAAPYQSILPVKGAIAVGIVGAIVSAFSNKPGAPKDPVVTLHDAPSQATTPAAQ